MRDRDAPREEWDDPPERPRKGRKGRKRRRGGMKALVVLAVLLPVLLLGGVGTCVGVRYFRGDEEELHNRFLGSWEGSAPEATWMTVRLTVRPDTLTVTGIDTRTGFTGSETMAWKVASVSRNKLVIRYEYKERKAGGGGAWAILFDSESEDVLTLRYLSSSTPDRVLRRRGKRVPFEERRVAAARERARLVGKWQGNETLPGASKVSTLDFAADGRIRITLDRTKGDPQVHRGNYEISRVEDNKVRLRLTGMEDYTTELEVRFRSDNEMLFAAIRPGGGHSSLFSHARRVP